MSTSGTFGTAPFGTTPFAAGLLGGESESIEIAALADGAGVGVDAETSILYWALLDVSAALAGGASAYEIRNLLSAAAASGVLAGNETRLLRGMARFGAAGAAAWEARGALASSVAMDDLLYLVYHAQILSEVELEAGVALDHTGYARITSALLLGGQAASLREAHGLLVDALALRELASAAEYLTLVSEAEFAAAVDVAYAAAARLADIAAMAVGVTTNATLYALLRDDVDFNATQLATYEGFAALRDTLGFALSSVVDNGQFTAWTMNTDSKGATKYTNYPFNSFMQIGGVWHGVADDGLYRLGGPDDDGEAIRSKLRLGMAALGTRLSSHAVSAYFGYTADGDLRLKVVTADSQTGTREAHVYRLYANDAAGSMRNSRSKIGKGLKAVYWDFVIENVDGANFELDCVEILPLVLDRRLRGNAGGKR